MKSSLLIIVIICLASCTRKQTPAPNTVGIITTIAGNGSTVYTGDGGPATAAAIGHPQGVAVDAGGNVYVIDGDNKRIRKITAAGVISTIAGNGTGLYSGDGGPATAAGTGLPNCIATGPDGSIYFADHFNKRVRMISTSGIIKTIAGTGIAGYNRDGIAATLAMLQYPSGIAVDDNGNVYIADMGNNRVRKIATNGIISTIAGGKQGYEGDGGPATDAQLYAPSGVALDGKGNVYIMDYRRIRKINTSGIIGTIAGNNPINTDSYVSGPAASAWINEPRSITADATGNVYIVDGSNIREINTVGAIFVVVGNGKEGYGGDGKYAGVATLNIPSGIALDSHGSIYIADMLNHRVRKVSK